MLLVIPNILSKEEVAQFRHWLSEEKWVDGNITSGQQSAMAKHNKQIPEDSPVAQKIGEFIRGVLAANPTFISAALPEKVFPPLFNQYSEGESFGTHIDNSIRYLKGTNFKVRSDLSATLFLSEPEEYDGGELHIEDLFGTHNVKLAAGDMVLYPSSSLHHVTPVKHGSRVSSFFWIQSMVRDSGQRSLLYQLDNSIQNLVKVHGHKYPEVISLTGIYHNLLRMWAESN